MSAKEDAIAGGVQQSVSSATEISFYHFTITPLVLGMSKLIKKIYYTKRNLLVLCKDEEEMNELDRTLWTFASREFIPHSKVNEPTPELQPVLLGNSLQDNKNKSEVLLSSQNNIENLDSVDFKKRLYAFYGTKNEVQPMMDFYQEYKTYKNITMIFWKQDMNGKWSNI